MPISDYISQPSSGTYTAGSANIPGVPSYIGNGSGQVLFTFDTAGNGDNVLYAIYEYNSTDDLGAYLIQSTGLTQAGEDWQTAATWTSTIYAKGLTAPKAYQFKIKAKNEAGDETDFCAYSTAMVPYIDLDVSPDSNVLSIEITTGNVKISGLTVTAVGAASPGVYTIAYILTRLNSPTTKANVLIEYGTDGVSYTALTDGSISGSITTLSASAAGTANSNTWASCVTVGNSYYATIYIRVTPYDTATAGNAGTAASTTIAVDNRPLAITISEFSGFAWDSDTTPEIIAPMASIVCGDYLYFQLTLKDSTGAIVQQLKSSEVIDGWYYEQVVGAGSAIRHPGTGWDTGWNAVTTYGVPKQYVYPNMATGNRVRYIFQTAVVPGNYTIIVKQAEVISHTI